MAELTDLSYIKALCKKYGFSFSKGLGQNFITNSSTCPQICEVAGIGPDINVLEVGPGFGTLTKQLALRAKKVVALEIDRSVLAVLNETLAGHDNVKIINIDVMKANLAEIIETEFDGEVVVCANLPYYITSPILMRLLEEKLPISSITAMVQKEAAQRLCAMPGKRECGAITYTTHYYSSPEMIFDVEPESFFPPPKVTSTVIKLDVKPFPLLAENPEKEKNLFRLIKSAFAQRRKTLVNSVSSVLGIEKPELIKALESANIAPLARAEQLLLEDYIKLEQLLF